MNFFNFRKRREARAEQITPPIDEVLLKALLQSGEIGASEAMNIPAVAESVRLISETVSMIPIKLYEEKVVDGKKKTIEISDDDRTSLLNNDTKDAFGGVQFKRALVKDYLLYGNTYAFINKQRNKFKSINYVPCKNVYILSNFEDIFKDYDIMVSGKKYKPFEFLKILRSTKNGASGVGIVQENSKLLKVAKNIKKM